MPITKLGILNVCNMLSSIINHIDITLIFFIQELFSGLSSVYKL